MTNFSSNDSLSVIFPPSDDMFQTTLQNVQLVGILLQYFSALSTIIAGSWIVNKFTWNNDTLKSGLETIFCILIFIPIFPAFTTFFGLTLIIRKMISIYLKIFPQKGNLSLLSPVDAFWAYESHASTSTFNGLYIFEGICDLEKIQKTVKKTLESDLVGGKMSKKLSSFMGFPCWEDVENIDIKDHVKVILNNNNNKEGGVNEQQVFQYLKNVQDIPITGKAPWEINVIPKFTYRNSNVSKNTYAVIFRINHSIMDGISTGNVLTEMADKKFNFSIDPVEPLGFKKQWKLEIFIAHLLGILCMPKVWLKTLLQMDNWHNKHLSPGSQLTGPKTFTWSKPIKMDALKKIKNETKTSVYSVLLTSLGGAFHKLYSRNGLLPKSDYFHCMCPVALIPYPDRKPQNRFTGVVVPAYVGRQGASGGVDLNPKERLELNYNNLKNANTNLIVIGGWYYFNLIGSLPLFLNKLITSSVHLKMSLSNIPGPSEPVFMFGGKIVDIGAWIPIKQSVGFGMGLFSNGDRVRATLIGDKASFPNDLDVQFLTDAFEEELLLLARTVGLEENMLYISD